MRSFFLSSALALSALAWAPHAFACTVDPCGPGVRTFGDDAVVPGNLVFFAILDQSVALALVDTNGVAIAASVRTIGKDRVFAPNETIEAGEQVRLRWSYRCEANGEERSGEYSFKTAEEAEPFTSSLSLKLVEQGVRPWSSTTRGADDWREGFATVAPASASGVAGGTSAHLLEVAYQIDGVDAATGADLTVRSPCDRAAGGVDTCGVQSEHAAGTHSITAVAHLIGSAGDIALAPLKVDTSCPFDARFSPDAGATTTTPSLDAGLLDAGRDASSPVSDAQGLGGMDAKVFYADAGGKTLDSGCSLARTHHDSALLALGLLLLLRRKRAG